MTGTIGGKRTITDSEVQAGTGKDWAEWRLVLDAWDASQKQLIEIVDYVVVHYQVTDVWAQESASTTSGKYETLAR